MSSLLPDNIKPVVPEQFLKLRKPQWYLALRIVLALLTLAYAYWVPAELLLVSYTVFMVGVVLYVVLQCLLGLFTILNGASPSLLNASTVIDIVGMLFALLNDPSLLPPTLMLAPAALTLAIPAYRPRSFITVSGSALVLLAVALMLRQTLLHKPYDLYFAVVALFFLVATCPPVVLCIYVKGLRLRAARITETDPLTGLGNRWTFYEAAKYLLPYHQRNMTPMVVMFAEIDLSKNEGRRIGKSARQDMLKQFASIADHRLRSSDIAVHYGHNEFAFLLADTSINDAETIAFNLQQQFDDWARQKNLPVYVYIGLSAVPNTPVALDQILISINAALYRAQQTPKKVSGTVFATPEQSR